jgi:2-succinyl-5-enolpyruvyl-6-hydroxy-3-cyclohexene-1-carboxylate synthase
VRAEFLQTEWFRAFVGGLASAGVTDVVVSPGSRSTPLVAAAALEPRLHVETCFDERSASFYALGLGRAAGRPAVLLRTSGSAGGHDLPAVMEAREARVPLIVITADRPPELHGAGASQTADQRRLFGHQTVLDIDLGPPDRTGIEALARKAAQVVRATMAPVPGAVHVNAPARKPLEPVEPQGTGERSLRDRVDARIRAPVVITEARPRFGPAAFATVEPLLHTAGMGLVVAGPRRGPRPDPDVLRDFLARSGFVLAAETGSGLRGVGGGHELLWPHWSLTGAAADVVITLGGSPTSRTLQRVVGTADCLVHVDPFDLVDPEGRVRQACIGPVDDFLARASAHAQVPRDRLDLDARIPPGLDAVLQAEAGFDEARVTRWLGDHLPADAALVLGNSLTIRAWDRFAAPPPGPVFVQRGLSGIDGLVSGAAGIAQEHDGPTVLVLGDVSFLHDVNGLWMTRTARRPFVVVVLDNGGGRIFDELPVASTLPELMPLFRTPVDVDRVAVARGFGVAAEAVRDFDQLEASLRTALLREGPTVLVAEVAANVSDASDRMTVWSREALG